MILHTTTLQKNNIPTIMGTITSRNIMTMNIIMSMAAASMSKNMNMAAASMSMNMSMAAVGMNMNMGMNMSMAAVGMNTDMGTIAAATNIITSTRFQSSANARMHLRQRALNSPAW